MKKNHEIRFPCDLETKKFADNLRNCEFAEISKSGFYAKVFTYGLIKLFSLNPEKRFTEIFKKHSGISNK